MDNKIKKCSIINNYIQESLLTNLNINEKKIINYLNNYLFYNKYLLDLNIITNNQDYNYQNNNIEIENQLINNEEKICLNILRDELFSYNNELTEPIIDNKNNDIDFIRQIDYYD